MFNETNQKIENIEKNFKENDQKFKKIETLLAENNLNNEKEKEEI